MKNLILFFASIMALWAVADSNKDYLKERRRMINREIVGTNVVYTYARGTKLWCETNVLKRAAIRVGPVRYSKLKLIRVAKSAGKWDELKAAIVAMDMEDEWQACQHIQSDDPSYIAATNAVVTRGIATDAAVKAFMASAED